MLGHFYYSRFRTLLSMAAALILVSTSVVAVAADTNRLLLDAARDGLVEDAKRLIESGANVNARDSAGRTPLMFAANAGDTKLARLLLEKGADPNTRCDDGSTPLMKASQYGYEGMLKLLQAKGADMRSSDGKGLSTLISAEKKGHTQPAKLLPEQKRVQGEERKPLTRERREPVEPPAETVVPARPERQKHAAAGSSNGVRGREVIVSTVGALVKAVKNARAGDTIVLEDGTYKLHEAGVNMIWVSTPRLTVRSRSGDREKVILEGKGMQDEAVGWIFNVNARRFTVRDMTLQKVRNHAIQTQVDVDHTVIRNLIIRDTGEQMVKVAYDPARQGHSSDHGVMEGCLLEYSAGVGPQQYIGGIDAHNARNWIVRDNTFKGIKSPGGEPAEHAIHFWSDSRNTLVERNLIINCDRGIGLGLGQRGHLGGIIRNNMIYHERRDPEGLGDVAIGLESALNAWVYNNTIFMEHGYPRGIEYRWGGTRGVRIINNLTNKPIASRDGGRAVVRSNVTGSRAKWFLNPAAGDLHLKSCTIGDVVDRGRHVAGLTDDFDGDTRPKGAGINIGADQCESANVH